MELKGKYIGYDFSERDLDGYVLIGDFTGADFTGASLVGADLRKGTFTDAKFSRAKLKGAKKPLTFALQIRRKSN